ncbi:MAG: hypothetical protein ACRDA3_13140 [Peptostreptococcaceae bacterium]
MITNNNFFGKIKGKNINDFSRGLDYSIETAKDRIEYIEKRLELNKSECQFGHEFFSEVFEQTFDTQLDKDASIWVDEEGRFMDSQEFTSWCKINSIAIDEYLDKTVPFDELGGKGEWIYSNVNTSNIKLLLNKSDALYSDSNISKELSKMADYILAKDDKKKEDRIDYKFYTDEALFKIECEQYNPHGDVNFNTIHFLQDPSRNYKKEKKQQIFAEDRKLPIIEDYNRTVEFLRSQLSMCKILEMKRDKEGLSENENKRLNYLQKWKGAFIRQIGKMEEDMVMIKDSIKGTIYFKAPLADAGEVDWDEIEYNNPIHIKALLQVKKRVDFTDTLACIVFDLEDAIENTKFTSKERIILKMYRNGATVADIAKELDYDYWSVDDFVNSIVGKIINTFYKNEENWYYLNICRGKYKTCSRCGEVKLATDTYFRKDIKGKYGVRSICKCCEKEMRRSTCKK